MRSVLPVAFSLAATTLSTSTAVVLNSETPTNGSESLVISDELGTAADPVFKFGEPTFFGSGCPKDTVAVVPSSDGQSVSVLFSEYHAETTSTESRDRKACNLAVPVDISSGASVGIFRVDYRGNVYVPDGAGADAFARFNAEYYFAGFRGPRSEETYPAGTAKDILLTHELPVAAVVWSPCGASTNFRVNTAITAYKPLESADATGESTANESVQIAIDSVDATVQTGFRYYLTWKKCTA